MAQTSTLMTEMNGAPLWIVRPLRERGRRIPRFVWAAGEENPPVGRLTVMWAASERHRRQMHVATLESTSEGRELLPMIRDVHVVALQYGDLTLAGFEEIEDREYAQTWFCRIARVGWEHRGKPNDPTGRSRD